VLEPAINRGRFEDLKTLMAGSWDLSHCVFLCAEKVERNIILITQNPAIMPRWDIKQIAGSHFDN
jgi:hypothetical protein